MRVAFRHPLLNDIAWLLTSPSLLKHDEQRLFPERVVSDRYSRLLFYTLLPWLRWLEAHPDALDHSLIVEGSRRLGHYHERLWRFLLEHWSGAGSVESSVVIKEGKRTVGELDLLFHDLHHQTSLHWELAVKFYLCARAGAGDTVWLGPNTDDTLEHKSQRLFEHQLPMGLRVTTHKGGSRHSQALVRGYLFYPFDSDWRRRHCAPDYIATNHLRGWWCRAHEFTSLLQQSDAALRWRILPRLSWMAPQPLHEGDEYFTSEQILAQVAKHFSVHKVPLLLAAYGPEPNVEGLWLEQSRGFVVDNHWGEAQGVIQVQ